MVVIVLTTRSQQSLESFGVVLFCSSEARGPRAATPAGAACRPLAPLSSRGRQAAAAAPTSTAPGTRRPQSTCGEGAEGGRTTAGEGPARRRARRVPRPRSARPPAARPRGRRRPELLQESRKHDALGDGSFLTKSRGPKGSLSPRSSLPAGRLTQVTPRLREPLRMSFRPMLVPTGSSTNVPNTPYVFCFF